MSLLDKASLIVTPNAYKESKLYSVVPSSGAGDMDVVRATTATRVNSAGLIEVVPRNLLTYSEEFDNAAWTKTNVTVTANSTNSPYGALTADTLNKSATGVDGTVVRIVTATATGYVGSIFVKKDTNTSRFPEFFLRSSDPVGENEIYVQLNTSTGATSIRLQFGTASVTAPVLINDYWRISFYALANSNTFRFGIRPAAGTTLGVFNSNATGSIIAWGAQVEDGSTATEYFPTTTRLNIPRIDYTNGSCPSLLVEPQRTNLQGYSNDFNLWTLSNTTVTANNGISPDGTQNADRVQFTTGGLMYYGSNGSAGSNTLSVYAKAKNGVSAKFRFFANGATLFSSNQTATGTWQRFTFTYTYTALTVGLAIATTGADDILFYGFQHELGTYPTSYIPTVASSVTRNADVISKTGISSLIGQTEGTLFAEFNLNESFGDDLIVASIETYYTNSIQIKYNKSNNTLGGQFFNGSSYIGILNTTAYTSGTAKVAYVYKSGAFKLFINGTLISTSTNTYSAQTFTSLGINALWNELLINKAVIKSVQVYKTALIDSECINLTTL